LSAIEARADGDAKWAAEKEMAAAQDSMLDGKIGRAARILVRPCAPRRPSSLAETGRLHRDRPNAFYET